MANIRNCSTNCIKQSVCAIFGTQSVCSKISGSHQSVRTFSRTSQLAKSRNFYDDLEIPRTATQSEIKHAYYNLSMAYHPDKNKSEGASIKFQRISEAYEVLGNFRTRRMYDKGIGSYGKQSTPNAQTGSEVVVEAEEAEEDDAQTKFYKQHMVKSEPPEMANRTTARDLDQWAVNRITESFNHKQRIKQMIRERDEDRAEAKSREHSKGVICVCYLLIICITEYMRWSHSRTHDAELKKINEKKS